MAKKTEPRYDVVIFNLETRVIDSVAGESMELDSGFYNAQKRLETVLPRLNDSYCAAIVAAGKYAKDKKLPRNVKTY